MHAPAPLTLPLRPRKLLLFSGHMVDAPDRAEPRFPPEAEGRVTAAIDDALHALGAEAQDAALTQGAAGGDVLFAEACVRRGVPVQLMLPLPEPAFVAASIAPCADAERWRERFAALKAALPWPPVSLPDAAGDPFESCNRWMLATALASGAAELHLVCLWDGKDGDGPGGTAHMVREVQRHHGRVTRLDMRSLR